MRRRDICHPRLVGQFGNHDPLGVTANGHDHSTVRREHRTRAGITRLLYRNIVPRLHGHARGKVQRLLGTVHDDHLVGHTTHSAGPLQIAGKRLTQARQPYATVREDDVWQTSLSPYAENTTRWNSWLRSTVGARFDVFRFDVAM